MTNASCLSDHLHGCIAHKADVHDSAVLAMRFAPGMNALCTLSAGFWTMPSRTIWYVPVARVLPILLFNLVWTDDRV